MDLQRATAVSTGAALIALVFLWAPAALAQDQRPDLRMERSPTPLPLVPPDMRQATEKDVQQAVEELKRQQRTDALIRDSVRTVPNRPDLGQDVVGGIQSRALRDARRPR